MTRDTPAGWLTENAALLPREGTVLDVACGRGRHALWLAGLGLQTRAIDRDPEAVAFVNAEARRLRLPLHADLVDLETGDVSLGEEAYDAIVVVHYLHRPLFAALRRALRSGGVLFYDTFTTLQAARGKPTNPDFLLREGELRQLVAPLSVVKYREGDFENKMVASVIARRV